MMRPQGGGFKLGFAKGTISVAAVSCKIFEYLAEGWLLARRPGLKRFEEIPTCGAWGC